ncbi:hypothetical protein CNYM01_03045 [Colletotrichum nymphaeae SA-01]|uniref:Uncharacterized protein n=1 Tax=Colletotrichum nymphaeae SA-01 TaxID=1460502 RepID=A0A135U416_9PEZI|nr:hypothetical protein CNYM01_03045 [Colletotrichum nymphaeae SA-01]
MAGNSWTVETEKALLLCIITTANNGTSIKPDWANVTRRMNRLGYSFTVAALSQHLSKYLQKPFNEQMDATADMPATPAPVPSSRKRAAPGSGTRAARISIAGGSSAAQAANEMASLALSADDGVDDDESDMEDSKKRVKIFHEGLVAALNGQHIDLTGNDTDANMENAAPVSGLKRQPIDLTGDLTGAPQREFKFEGDGTLPSFIRVARSRRMDLTKEFRSLTISDAAPAAPAESRFKHREDFNGWELEKRVWIACVNGRKQLMEINARKAAEKEEAAAKAAAEAANAMVLD